MTIENYKVLARKYRPTTFSELIGQDALRQTLANGIQTGRLAHAFILTGVRGVGKTTTARLLARALNCIGATGDGGPTTEPCGQCDACVSIGEDRYIDVIEIDAASRTGVDDIRDIIEGVRYKPVSARYKIYIIDEVHMLSKSAFNALLKTLEEPPSHAKFIFATTEIRKVPVTILSRCQRFDLKRIEIPALMDHFKNLLQKEGVTSEESALYMLAEAAEGSARDGLSLLDQAINLTNGNLKADIIKEMLGIGSQSTLLGLMEALLHGDILQALKVSEDLYKSGVEPEMILQDLLGLVHQLSLSKVDTKTLIVSPGNELQDKIITIGKQLSVPILTRAWQILLKGMQEIRQAPKPFDALEMILIRFSYIQDFVAPGQGKPSDSSESSPSKEKESTASVVSAKDIVAQKSKAENEQLLSLSQTFEDIVALFEDKRELLAASYLKSHVHFVSLKPGILEMRVEEGSPSDFVGTIRKNLNQWTNMPWEIKLSEAQGYATLLEKDALVQQEKIEALKNEPLIKKALELFPGSRLESFS
jgi:DNA polymerase-3 subunit gamma/tau